MKSKITKIIPYFLISLTLVVGIFSFAPNVQAQPAGPNDPGTCKKTVGETTNTFPDTRKQCEDQGGTFFEPGQEVNENEPEQSEKTGGGLESHLASCNGALFDLDDCVVRLTYYAFYTLPAFLLTLSAKFINIAVALGLSSAMYTSSDFIPEAWEIVRDLSNIFFILILLYIAFQTILGIGGGNGPKKMIAQVIIMALLINFSMFFTKIVIDSSNILALVFYNKLQVEPGGGDRPYLATTHPNETGIVEKDISGGLASSFDITRLMSEDFYKQAQERTKVVSGKSFAGYVAAGAAAGTLVPIPGVSTGVGALAGVFFYVFTGHGNSLPTGLAIGIILTAGSIMLYAAYSFFIAGIAFIARLIELWILIIFSPFAFMSSVVPKLSQIDGIGWESWLKKLLSTAFMAPVFMFFLYIIFKITQIGIFDNIAVRGASQQETTETLVLVTMSAIVVLILLKKATEYAKKGGGEIGEALLKGVKTVGGLAGGVAVGASLGLTGVVGRQTLGRGAAALVDSGKLKELATHESWLARKAGAVVLGVSRGFSKGSYDVRGIAGVDKALGATGLSEGAGLVKKQEGGYVKEKEDAAKRKVEFAESLQMSETEAERVRGTKDKDGNEIDPRVINKQRIETYVTSEEAPSDNKTLQILDNWVFASKGTALNRLRNADAKKQKKLEEAMLALVKATEKKAEKAEEGAAEAEEGAAEA